MATTQLRRMRYSAAALVVAATAACVDSPTTPSPATDVLAVEASALINKPPIDQSLQGQAWVCKDGSGPATNFDFAVSVDGGPATNHNIALGTCVQVASVPTNVFNFASISVTEGTPPSGWALASITIESNAATAHNPVINPPNASARISHDFGAVFTFTNTFTPPPPPPTCTRTQGYWKNHEQDWDDAGDGKPFLTTTIFYNSGVSYLTIMKTPPAKGNAYLQLAHQFIAASLNVNGASSGVAAVDAALAGADAYFTGAPAGIPNPTDPTRSQLQAWATTLDDFNNGRTGPGHCN